jgi:RNA polymerase sigma factor (sigma-70 family)
VVQELVEQAFTKRQLQGFKKHRFVFEANETDLLQIISTNKKPLELSMMEKDVQNLINNYLSTLPERYAKVIKGIIYNGKNYTDMSKELNITVERTRQIYKRGIIKLRTNDNFKKLINSGAIDLFKNTIFSNKEKELDNENKPA